ncbi:hypothetical protein KVG29_09495 [Caldicoprobacter algeriensis]|nr:hypothetical protein [Caldicoprobacter algeriensis]MCM8901454.1 hypothetical protein [Caldicoprobacter algeriensis]
MEWISINGSDDVPLIDFGFYYERWIEELSTWPDQFEPIPWAQPLE